jgi:TrmH family RNA methyltransferase
MEPVRNHRNKIVVEAARLHRARARCERGEALIEGPNLLAEAIAAGVNVKTVFALPGGDPPTGAILVDDRALARLAGTQNPRGPVAIIEIPGQPAPGHRSILVSYGVSDPGNVGTMIRTAASFEWDFGYTEGTADPWSPKVLRAGAGGQFQTSIIGIDALPNMPIVATVATGGGDPGHVDVGKIALLIGEEASGLDEVVIEHADFRVTIDTPGPTESLNAAVAAGILVHALSKRTGRDQGRV